VTGSAALVGAARDRPIVQPSLAGSGPNHTTPLLVGDELLLRVPKLVWALAAALAVLFGIGLVQIASVGPPLRSRGGVEGPAPTTRQLPEALAAAALTAPARD
jgi:hypothetical protein